MTLGTLEMSYEDDDDDDLLLLLLLMMVLVVVVVVVVHDALISLLNCCFVTVECRPAGVRSRHGCIPAGRRAR